jgi:hypothetical protein
MLSDRLVSGRAVRLPPLLLVLTALFLARVVGQALVALLGVGWLPPTESWYSGLLPYPLLLPVQVLILIAQGVIGRDVWRGQGFFARYRPRAGGRLQWLAVAYALAMLIRLVVTRSHPIPAVPLGPGGLPLHAGPTVHARAAPGASSEYEGRQRRLNTSRRRSVVRAVGLVRIFASCSPTTWKSPSRARVTTYWLRSKAPTSRNGMDRAWPRRS